MASFSVFKAKFKKTIADAIYQEITSGTAVYYHWFGKENSWQDFLSPFIAANPTEDAPGQPSDNFRYDLHVRRDILTAKKIKPSDVSYVVRRIDWVSGTVYDDYDDAYDTTNGYGFGPAYSGATRLEDSNFYVLTPQFNVYKCIWNNVNQPSAVMPTSTTPYVFETSDVYKWKFMYTIAVSLRNRFLSTEYMPVSNALKAGFYSSGEISSITIENGGSGYDPATTAAVISGDGYQEDNPVVNDSIVLNDGGDGYTSAPSITVADPFIGAIDWIASANVDPGSYIKYTNPSTLAINFYYVVSGTVLGTMGPTHTTGTTTNGSSQLKYVGTTATASLTISSGVIDSVTLDTAGYGYQSQPDIIVDQPFTEDANWLSSISVSTGDILLFDSRFYQVDSDHTTGSAGPIHTSGSTDNLTYLGANPDIIMDSQLTAAEIDLTITPGIDSVNTIIVSNPVPKYTETPTVTIGAPVSGTQATGIASISNGRITYVNVSTPGGGYVTAPAVTITTPVKTVDAANDVNNTSNTIEYVGHLLETGDEVEYSNGGGTDISGLTDGNTYYIIAIDENNFQLADSLANANSGSELVLDVGVG